MILWVVRWLVGYVQFEIIGADAQQFLTGASTRGYSLWNMKKARENCCSACIAGKDYRHLRQIAKKRRLRLKIKKRRGFPFLLRKWKQSRKYGLMIGAICAFALLCVFSTRVWVVNISGSTSLPVEEIRAAAAEFGLEVGTGKSSFDPLFVENELMLRFPALSWVTVNTWGSTVEIIVQDGDAKPEVEDPSEYSNVVAAKSGQIIRMDVYHGKALVKLGDGVAEGQLLVSGVQEFENGNVTFTGASAKIIARTRRQFAVSIPKEETCYEETGQILTRKSLHIFGIPIPLTAQGIPEGDYEKQSDRRSIRWNGVDLPLTIYEEVYRERSPYTAVISKEEALHRGEEALQEWMEQTLADGEILSKDLVITEENNSWNLAWNCICLENIARKAPFFVELNENNTSVEQ